VHTQNDKPLPEGSQLIALTKRYPCPKMELYSFLVEGPGKQACLTFYAG
jgi:hypothetical protein